MSFPLSICLVVGKKTGQEKYINILSIYLGGRTFFEVGTGEILIIPLACPLINLTKATIFCMYVFIYVCVKKWNVMAKNVFVSART